MGLSKLAGVHPYVADRVRYILQVADHYGASYTITSAWRTQAAQANLWVKQNRLPAAFPGCSSHEYGLAVDVVFRDPRWQQLYQQVAPLMGLHTVPGDNVHVQALAPSVMKSILQQRGLCPSPSYKNLFRGGTSTNEMMCGRDGGFLALKEGGGFGCFKR